MRGSMTGRWSEWEVIRRQVAVCGRVIAGPESTRTMEVRVEGSVVDTTSVGPDGIYFFLDLPPGDYTVTVVEAHGEVFGEGRASVDRNDLGDVSFACVDVTAGGSGPPQKPPPSRRRRSR
jgi:hypothetical protein